MKTNQISITQKINDISNTLNNLVFNFEEYLRIKDTIDQITFILDIIENTLTELENSITFSHLNTLNLQVINIQNMMLIIDQAKSIYGIENLPFPLDLNYLMDYYEIAEVASYFSHNRITFMIKIPIVLPEPFNYYHLYPVPNKNNTIIIPKSSFLLSSTEDYKPIMTPCQRHQDWYYCSQDMPTNNDYCLQELLKKKSTNNCILRQTTNSHEKVEMIDDQHFILLLPTETEVTEKCETSSTTIMKGNFLITLTPNCLFATPENKFSTVQGIEGTGLVLPSIQKPMNYQETQIKPLRIENVKLDKINQLHHIEELEAPFLTHWHTIGYSTTIPLVLIGITLALIYGYLKLRTRKIRRQTKSNQVELLDSQLHPNLRSGDGGVI